MVDLDEAADRPAKREYESGISEIGVGLIGLVVGLYGLPWTSHISEFFVWATMAASALAFLFIWKTMTKLRSNEEFPRVGYTKPKLSRVFRLAIWFGTYLVYLLVRDHVDSNILHLVLTGIILAGTVYYYFYVGLKYRELSAIWLGFFSIAWCALAYWRAGSNALPWILTGLGAVMTLDGVWHFVRFRRGYPKLEDPEL